jgi:hypothetical protein
VRTAFWRWVCMSCVTVGASAAWAKDEAPAKLPEIVVSPLQEERPVGAYDQPEWTTHRRFATTRVFLQQTPGDFGFEQWWRGRFKRNGQADVHRLQEELEIGLPHRLQLDLYETWTITQDGPTKQDSVAAELRWALADWGRIPMNPTLYGEWKFMNTGSDVYELKLLLGDELGHGWHWGINGVWEQEIEDAEATEYALSAALSRTLLDERLSLGLESQTKLESEEGSRGEPEKTFLLGPSLQWRPSARTHLDVVPLFGLNEEAPHVESYMIFGVDFGGPKKARKAKAPVSLQSD